MKFVSKDPQDIADRQKWTLSFTKHLEYGKSIIIFTFIIPINL
jgi:hypothetical protein